MQSIDNCSSSSSDDVLPIVASQVSVVTVSDACDLDPADDQTLSELLAEFERSRAAAEVPEDRPQHAIVPAAEIDALVADACGVAPTPLEYSGVFKKPAARKRPASSTSPRVLKRPSTPWPEELWRTDDNVTYEVNLKRIHSRAWHRERSRQLKFGVDIARASELAKAVARDVVEAWKADMARQGRFPRS